MEEDVYVLLTPEQMDVEDHQNYHLVKATWDRAKKKLNIPSRRVLCNGWDRKKNLEGIPDSRILARDDEDAIRLFLARQQNAGNNICANCVRHFYSGD